MPDEPLPDEETLSKRERQKLRRQRKLAAQRVEQRRARRRRTLVTAVVVILLVGATGAFAAQWAMDRAEERRLMAAAAESLDELGCTTVQEQPILGQAHFSGPELADNPPDVVYPDRPATSGTHIGSWVITGVYDKVIDERVLVHNLEHGYVSMYYHEDAPADEVEQLKAFAQDHIDSRRHEKIVVSAWKADLPDGGNFAFAAWGARQVCEQFDEGVALSFLSDYHYLAGNAPERELAPHFDTNGIDPDDTDGDLLYPPLDDAPDIDAEEMDAEEGDADETDDSETDDSETDDS